MIVYILFHETNTGHSDESDGYVEAVYATEALAEAARAEILRGLIADGEAVWSDPDDPDFEGPSEWEHDFRIVACEVVEGVR